MSGDTPGAGGIRMGAEIERKFLLRQPGQGPALVAGLPGVTMLQGYFGRIDGWSVRLRITSGDDGAVQAWLTLKTTRQGSSREEIEQAVPESFARPLLEGSGRLVRKIRHRLPHGELVWEIDRFLGRHEGLWLAEIELPQADYPVALPDWLGADVTDDPRYRNEALAAPEGPAARTSAPAELVATVRRLLQQTGQAAPAPVARQREARLAANLRANLQRRKQQLRGREDVPLDAAAAAPSALPDGRTLDRDDSSA